MVENSGTGSGSIVHHSWQAAQDLSEIFIYTVEQWGEEQAERYLTFLHDVELHLAANPNIAPSAPELSNVRFYVAKWPGSKHGHRIFFREIPDGIHVLRVLHTARAWSSIGEED